MTLVTTRIFPGAENPLDLALELSEKLRFSEPCPLSLSDGFRAAYPSRYFIRTRELLLWDDNIKELAMALVQE